jgi:hypothetical protein
LLLKKYRTLNGSALKKTHIDPIDRIGRRLAQLPAQKAGTTSVNQSQLSLCKPRATSDKDMTRSTQSLSIANNEGASEPFSHDLIGSGAWILPLILATFLVYLEFRKNSSRGKLALGLLMATGLMIILVPPLGSLILMLTMFGLIVMVLESMH